MCAALVPDQTIDFEWKTLPFCIGPPSPSSQDWCVAAAEGADVPEVRLVWCCRFLSEMELVGEAIPSLLASAGAKKDTHFSMSLYCSSSAKVLDDDVVVVVIV